MPPKCIKTCGGSGLNTIRAFQFIIKYPFKSVFFGSIGKDKNG